MVGTLIYNGLSEEALKLAFIDFLKKIFFFNKKGSFDTWCVASCGHLWGGK